MHRSLTPRPDADAYGGSVDAISSSLVDMFAGPETPHPAAALTLMNGHPLAPSSAEASTSLGAAPANRAKPAAPTDDASPLFSPSPLAAAQLARDGHATSAHHDHATRRLPVALPVASDAARPAPAARGTIDPQAAAASQQPPPVPCDFADEDWAHVLEALPPSDTSAALRRIVEAALADRDDVSACAPENSDLANGASSVAPTAAVDGSAGVAVNAPDAAGSSGTEGAALEAGAATNAARAGAAPPLVEPPPAVSHLSLFLDEYNLMSEEPRGLIHVETLRAVLEGRTPDLGGEDGEAEAVVVAGAPFAGSSQSPPRRGASLRGPAEQPNSKRRPQRPPTAAGVRSLLVAHAQLTSTAALIRHVLHRSLLHAAPAWGEAGVAGSMPAVMADGGISDDLRTAVTVLTAARTRAAHTQHDRAPIRKSVSPAAPVPVGGGTSAAALQAATDVTTPAPGAHPPLVPATPARGPEGRAAASRRRGPPHTTMGTDDLAGASAASGLLAGATSLGDFSGAAAHESSSSSPIVAPSLQTITYTEAALEAHTILKLRDIMRRAGEPPGRSLKADLIKRLLAMQQRTGGALRLAIVQDDEAITASAAAPAAAPSRSRSRAVGGTATQLRITSMIPALMTPREKLPPSAMESHATNEGDARDSAHAAPSAPVMEDLGAASPPPRPVPTTTAARGRSGRRAAVATPAPKPQPKRRAPARRRRRGSDSFSTSLSDEETSEEEKASSPSSSDDENSADGNNDSHHGALPAASSAADDGAAAVATNNAEFEESVLLGDASAAVATASAPRDTGDVASEPVVNAVTAQTHVLVDDD